MADSKKRTDLILGAVLMGFGGWLWWVANEFPRGTAVDPMGPAFWPQLLADGIVVFSAVLLITTLLRKPGPEKERAKEAEEEAVEEIPFSPSRFWGTIGLLVVYLAALGPIGFFIATPLFLAGLLLLLNVRSPKMIAGTALGLPLLWGGVFGYVLGVPLPEGIFTIIVR